LRRLIPSTCRTEQQIRQYIANDENRRSAYVDSHNAQALQTRKCSSCNAMHSSNAYSGFCSVGCLTTYLATPPVEGEYNLGDSRWFQRTLTTNEDSMQHYVRIYQDGDAIAVATTLTDESDFNRSVSAALSEFLASAAGSSEQLLASVLPQIVDLCCSMRGYKAPLVEKQTLLIAGRIPPRDSTLVASSEEKSERETVAG
jgi:hypothetical protein